MTAITTIQFLFSIIGVFGFGLMVGAVGKTEKDLHSPQANLGLILLLFFLSYAMIRTVLSVQSLIN